MIKTLKIQNLILIESAEVTFCKGFNVLSGETGSGKSAILESLKLVFGFRCDANLVRKGAEKAGVEAIIDIGKHPEILDLFEKSGIDHDQEEDLVIRRDLSINGKSRAFVNQQIVQISFLKKLGELILSFASQQANKDLYELDQQLQMLDIFSESVESRENFVKSYQKEKELLKKIFEFEASESERLRELETCKREIEELEEANLREGEEESLFVEYELLSSAEDRMQKSQEVLHFLTSEKSALILLKRQKILLEQLAKQDSTTEKMVTSFNTALLELEEVAFELRNYLNKLENDPNRLKVLEDRLTLLNKLKKKYGSNCQEMILYLNECKKRKNFLENADRYIDDVKEELQKVQLQNEQMLQKLTDKRKKGALKLEAAVTRELQSLNMPKAEFSVSIQPEAPSVKGQERIEFYIKPNLGEGFISVRNCASGGEVSRLLLALKTALAGKESKLSLIFDEIDANIGGATASIIGEKLKNLGKSYQVICITHFSQVAKQADHHLQISKQEKEGRTLTFISILDETNRQKELLRMQGY